MSENEAIMERLRELEQNLVRAETQLENVSKQLDNLNGGITRGLWILGGGFLAAFASWIVTGGLIGGGHG